MRSECVQRNYEVVAAPSRVQPPPPSLLYRRPFSTKIKQQRRRWLSSLHEAVRPVSLDYFPIFGPLTTAQICPDSPTICQSGVQNFAKWKKRNLKIMATTFKFAQVRKFCPIWSHCELHATTLVAIVRRERGVASSVRSVKGGAGAEQETPSNASPTSYAD